MLTQPTNVFLDTDIGPDCDDTAALSILLERCRQGRAKLLGVTHCTGSPYGLAAIDSICRLFGVSVPLGTCADKNFLSDEKMTRYTRAIAEQFDHGFPPDAPQPDAVDALIRGISGAEDESVTFIAIGPLNNLARFLSDPVAGPLMQKKVGRIVIMAGCFEADPVFTEWNVEMDIPAARTVCALWTKPLDFCPWEALGHVHTGSDLSNYADTPITVAYRIFTGGKMRRPSWDLGTVEMALGEVPGLQWSAPGRIEIDEKGITRFTPDPSGNRRYVRNVSKDYETACALDDILNQSVRTMLGADSKRRNVRSIGDCLFFHWPQYMDMDTGETFAKDMTPEEELQGRNLRLIPQHPNAPVYQRYYRLLREVLGIADDRGLADYPEFELSPNAYPKVPEEYYDKAYHYAEELEILFYQNRSSDSPAFDPGFPTWFEYAEDFRTQFAKQWCDREGIPWFEEPPHPKKINFADGRSPCEYAELCRAKKDNPDIDLL